MRPFRPALLVAACLLSAGAASAQTAAPAPDGRTPPSREARRADWAARRQAHEAREVADLSTVLRLRPEQQGGLRAWLEAGRPAPGERGGGDRMRDGADSAPQTTAQALDRQAARMSEREGRMRAHLDATRRFYASLAPDQQAAFDALQRLRHGGGGRGGWGRHGMGQGGMRMGWRGAEGAPPAGD